MLRLVLVACLAGAAAADEGDLDTARRHFDAGAIAYEKGDYHAALEEFLTAQRLHRVPAFDYNIGRCYDRLEQLDDAIQLYERYVATNPPDGEKVRTRIIELRRRLELQRPPQPPPPPPSHKKRNLGIVLGVVGGVVVVGVAVGLGVGLSAGSESYSASTLGPMRVTP
jgi:iron complex outermembrane receptor protein